SSLPCAACRSGVLLDVTDRVADRPEVLHVVSGDLDAELPPRGDHYLDHGQRVHVEVVDEGFVELYVRGGDAGDLVDDLCKTAEDLLLGVCHTWFSLVSRGSAASGYAVCRDWFLRKGDDLGGVDQTGAKADDQGETAALDLAGFQHSLHRERDRRRGGVALVRDIAGHRYVGRQLECLDHGIGDPHVGLVRDERVEVFGSYTGEVEGSLRDLGTIPHCPAEDRVTRHPQVWPFCCPRLAGGARFSRPRSLLDIWSRYGSVLVAMEGLGPALVLGDEVGLRAVRSPLDGTDGRIVGGPDDGCSGAVGEQERGGPVEAVGHIGQARDADDQDVPRRSGTHHALRELDPKAEAGARR